MKRRLPFIIALLAIAVIGGLWWGGRISSTDAREVRQLLERRNAVLQAGDGARYDGLLFYPSVVERTAALGLAQAVVARHRYLRAIAIAFGPPAAVQAGCRLPCLREFTENEIETSTLVRSGGEIDAQFDRSYSVRVVRTRDGWKLAQFGRPLPQVIAEYRRATLAFDHARVILERTRVKSPDEALRLFTSAF